MLIALNADSFVLIMNGGLNECENKEGDLQEYPILSCMSFSCSTVSRHPVYARIKAKRTFAGNEIRITKCF